MSIAATIESMPREVLITAKSGRKPLTVARLNDWHYIEQSLMRLIAAWGRYFPAWSDKTACHRHIYEQAECVQKLRDRLTEFPGTKGNLDAPVSQKLENLVNTVLQAPTFEDAIDGVYSVLMGALTTAYLEYGGKAHPVHDAPTLSTLHQVLGFKNGMRLWLRDYRRRHPHTINADYKAAIESELANCFDLKQAVPIEDNIAAPCGVNTDYRLPARFGKPENSTPKLPLEAEMEPDFTTSIEMRRLFWCYGYMQEMGLAEDMLRWVWAAHYMPWDYQYQLARHLWDESRHGDSGYSRLLDFGITLADVGYPRYGGDARGPYNDDGTVDYAPNMTPEDLFNQAYFIGMVAETAHFTVKNEAYNDFKDGGDLESAEMMLFDVIDEGNHVRYCHEWLPELARRAGVDLGDYRARAAQIRAEKQQTADERAATKRSARQEDSPAFQELQRLLEIMRTKHPLSNAQSCPPRSSKPM